MKHLPLPLLKRLAERPVGDGGLRFLEAAHVKDLISFLRILENPRDQMAWFRVLQLIDGIGPSSAARESTRFRE